MFDMMKMMGKLKDVQEKMKQARETLTEITAEGESGGGMVTATVNGKKQVISLQIDDDLVKVEDKDMMKDLIIAAINKATEEVEQKAAQHMQQATEGLIPNIPGMNLGDMFNA